MSSSSSDSDEDDSRFREICDPILSKAFNVATEPQNIDKQTSEKHLENGIEEISNTDHRQSFLLLSKLRQSLKHQENLLSSKSSSLYHRKTISEQNRSTTEPSKPSYLARQLSSLLDQNIEISNNDEDLLTNESETAIKEMLNGTPKNPTEDFSLMHGVFLSKTDVNKQTSKKRKKKQKKCDIIDEEELSNRCRNIAVTPEWILQKQGIYPWPHPKNIRYLDKYKGKKKKGANGVTLLTPIKDVDCQTNGANIGDVNKKLNNTKSTMKVKSSLNASVNKKSDQADLKNNLEIQTKKRKQSRKRGGKKKIKNEQSTGILLNCKDK